MDIQREQLERLNDFLGPTTHSSSTMKRQSTITFSNPAAEQFFVDGTKIPDVNFDAGPSWSGLMPISGDPNETRKLFFWFWPTNNPANTKDLLFWTNGGPGCSSLEGFLQENGPISWSWGQAEPTPNMWSWTNLTNVLWLAAEVAGFLGQFLEGNNFWVTGESKDVPYIANFLYENPGLELNLKGIWIADPSLSYGVVQQEIPALRFARANQNLFPFNSSFYAELQTISDNCGYTDYLDKFVTYPPAGLLPLPVGTNGTFTATPACRIHSPIQRAVGVLNPVFDVYRISLIHSPTLWSVLGFPRSTQEFVQDAIHAPHIVWNSCASRSVYLPGGDRSIASTLSKSERVVIVHGLAVSALVCDDHILIFSTANMTWGGAQGFQTPIEPETFRLKDFGVYGNEHTERGLTCAFVSLLVLIYLSLEFVPWAAFSTLSFLLGKQDSPST
ncbi:alpha/beta-hydrolase [Mycena filopes]|nr:alpha/beta-hydrolase [Mycena filopes]